MGRPRKYTTEEERKEARRVAQRKWRVKNKKKIAEYSTKYYQEHKNELAEYMAKYNQEHKDEIAKYYQEHKEERKEKISEYMTKRYNTKEGRAYVRIRDYKREDKKHRRGNCDLTMPWFIRNIFTKCIYCGESDWKKLGCDRIDNSLPHTIENVVPCCAECNAKRHMKPFEQFYWESKHKTLGEES